MERAMQRVQKEAAQAWHAANEGIVEHLIRLQKENEALKTWQV